MSLPNQHRPCKNCPFRKDCLRGWLSADRMRHILQTDSFTCHANNNLQCAGHMIIRGNNNIFVKTALSLGIPFRLVGKEKVFESAVDCVAHHK